MLRVSIGAREGAIRDSMVDAYFDNNYYPEWFDDEIVKLGELKDKDIQTDLEYEMVLIPSSKGIAIENDNSVVYTRYDYLGKLLEFLP